MAFEITVTACPATLHTRLRVQRAPGIPHPLWREIHETARARRVAGRLRAFACLPFRARGGHRATPPCYPRWNKAGVKRELCHSKE
jgi:hypothetical protein